MLSKKGKPVGFALFFHYDGFGTLPFTPDSIDVVSFVTVFVIPFLIMFPSGEAKTTITMITIAATTITPYSSRNVFIV